MRRVPLNDLSRDPYKQCGLGALMTAANSASFILGSEVRAFEEEFADYVGVTDCVGVASGTDALRLSLRAVGVRPGHTVVMAANAGMYAASATVDIGAFPDWVDVDTSTATMDPAALQTRLAQGEVAAVVATHLYGNMAGIEAIARVCLEHDLPLIEDCAQAAGAQVEGIRAGAWGDCAAFSFYPTKNLGAWGDGGAVTSRRPEIAEEVRALRQYGWSTKYVADRPFGSNSRLDELQAAVLRTRLPRLDDCNRRRREICRNYRHALPESVRLLFAEGEAAVGHLAVIVLPTSGSRTQSIQVLDDRGVGTDIHYPIPDHKQTAMAQWVSPQLQLAVTEDLSERVVTVPCFPDLTAEEVATVTSALAELPA